MEAVAKLNADNYRDPQELLDRMVLAACNAGCSPSAGHIVSKHPPDLDSQWAVLTVKGTEAQLLKFRSYPNFVGEALASLKGDGFWFIL